MSRFWDIMQIVGPIAATAIAGPVGGIVASGAMGAGTGFAKGEGLKGALLRGGLGAGTGALTAGALGSLSKGAETAAAKSIEKATMDATLQEAIKAGPDALTPVFTDTAMRAGEVAGKAAEMSAKNNALQRFADITSKARGKHPAETQGMLRTVAGGANTLGQVSQILAPDERRTFSQVQGMAGMPGMSPMYQYGYGGYGGYGSGVTSSTGRRFY